MKTRVTRKGQRENQLERDRGYEYRKPTHVRKKEREKDRQTDRKKERKKEITNKQTWVNEHG